jgi:hypothetical protein
VNSVGRSRSLCRGKTSPCHTHKVTRHFTSRPNLAKTFKAKSFQTNDLKAHLFLTVTQACESLHFYSRQTLFLFRLFLPHRARRYRAAALSTFYPCLIQIPCIFAASRNIPSQFYRLLLAITTPRPYYGLPFFRVFPSRFFGSVLPPTSPLSSGCIEMQP